MKYDVVARLGLPGLAFLGLGLAGCPGTHTPGGTDAGVDAPVEMLDAPAPVDAPTGGDAPTATDAPLLPPLDAGDPFGDAGMFGTPDWVSIDILTTGTCDPLVPCGGDVVGSWDVTGGCIEVPIGDMLSRCPGATVDATGMTRGRVTFDGTFAVRHSQSIVSMQIFVPTFCVNFIPNRCVGLEMTLQGQAPDSACVEEADGCHCSLRSTFEIDDMDAYTIDAATNEIVSTSSGKRWSYCVDAGTLRYEDTSPPSSTAPFEPGIITLGAR